MKPKRRSYRLSNKVEMRQTNGERKANRVYCKGVFGISTGYDSHIDRVCVIDASDGD